MPYSTRTIGFHCELLHPPGPVDPTVVQQLHNELFQSADPPYRSFAVNHDGCVLSNTPARMGAVSQVFFGADRIRFNEENSGLTTEEFVERVVTLGGRMAQAKQLAVFVGQVVTVRTLVNPRHYPTALDLLREGVLRWSEDDAALGRPVGGLGVRLVLPGTPEHPNAFNVRVESIPTDRRSVFLENQASFPPLPLAEGLDAVRARIEATYAFLTGPVLELLAKRDGDGSED